MLGPRTFTRVARELRQDLTAAQDRDPAARGIGRWEILLTYPGVHAVLTHRVAHALHDAGVPVVPRALAYFARMATNIEIHPAAQIGEALFIDHGTGVVIGETSEVGRNVTIYQGVSLAGTSLKREKRHPTLGDIVVVGAGAKIIGGFTIGDNSRIGAGSVVVREVPPNSVVVGVPGRITHKDGQRVEGIDLNQTDLPDPVARAIEQLLERIRALEGEVETLRKSVDPDAQLSRDER